MSKKRVGSSETRRKRGVAVTPRLRITWDYIQCVSCHVAGSLFVHEAASDNGVTGKIGVQTTNCYSSCNCPGKAVLGFVSLLQYMILKSLLIRICIPQ